MYQTKESRLKAERCGVYNQGPVVPFKGSSKVRACVRACVLEITVCMTPLSGVAGFVLFFEVK